MARKKKKTRFTPPPPHKNGGGGARDARTPRLIFPSPSDAVHGFTSSKQFTNDSASCVRELIQNSLDAALVGAKEKTAEIRFSIENVSMEKISSMEEYRIAFESAKKRKTNRQADNVVRGIEGVLKNSEVSVLYVADNGTGFSHEQLSAMLSVSVSDKPEEAGGSFGIGHLTAYALSNLNYIFYGSVLKDDGTLSTGHAILASHENKKGIACSKDGYFVCAINIAKLDFNSRFVFGQGDNVPEVLRSHMDRIHGDWGHGALVAIVGFNRFGEGGKGKSKSGQAAAEVILQEAASNFFVAIGEGRLKVTVEESSKVTLSVGKDDLRRVLSGKKEEKNTRRTGFPAGGRVWNAYETYVGGSEHIIETTYGDVHLRLREGGEGRKIAVCRNGMWITDKVSGLESSRFADKVNFDALLLVDSRSKGRVHDILRLAEPPLHNEINLKNITSEDEERDQERSEFRGVIREIREKLGELISKRSEESFPIDDILAFEGSGTAEGKQPYGKRPLAKIDSSSGGKTGKGKGTKRKKRTPNSRPGASLSPKISGLTPEPGVLDIFLKPREDCDNVEMWISLDEGKDITCTGAEVRDTYVTINETSIGKVNETDGITSVCLGSWKEGIPLSVSVKYTLPRDVQKEHALNYDFARRRVPQKEKGDAAGAGKGASIPNPRSSQKEASDA